MASSSGHGLPGETALPRPIPPSEMALLPPTPPSGMVLPQSILPSRTKLLNRIKLPNRVNSKYGR